jgi:hypothetical protein
MSTRAKLTNTPRGNLYIAYVYAALQDFDGDRQLYSKATYQSYGNLIAGKKLAQKGMTPRFAFDNDIAYLFDQISAEFVEEVKLSHAGMTTDNYARLCDENSYGSVVYAFSEVVKRPHGPTLSSADDQEGWVKSQLRGEIPTITMELSNALSAVYNYYLKELAYTTAAMCWYITPMRLSVGMFMSILVSLGFNHEKLQSYDGIIPEKIKKPRAKKPAAEIPVAAPSAEVAVTSTAPASIAAATISTAAANTAVVAEEPARATRAKPPPKKTAKKSKKAAKKYKRRRDTDSEDEDESSRSTSEESD